MIVNVRAMVLGLFYNDLINEKPVQREISDFSAYSKKLATVINYSIMQTNMVVSELLH